MIKSSSPKNDFAKDIPPPNTSPAKRPKLVLLISSLAMGGAERVVSLLARGWDHQDMDLVVVTLADQDEDFYPLPKSVQRVCLGWKGPSENIAKVILNNLRRILSLRQALRRLRPSAVISHLDAMNVIAIIASAGLKIPVLVTEHTDLDEYRKYLPLPWRVLRKYTYKKAAAVVAVSENTVRQLSRFVPQKKLHVIPNPTDPGGCLGKPHFDIQGPAVISMGRLVKSKGFDVLLKAFQRVCANHPDWKLLLLGDGPERANLESLSNRLGIVDRCVFAGALSNPGPVLAQAEIFALASRLEGFPMSLIEAMVCGLPVICTKYSPDTGKIVADGVDGILVDVDDEAGFGHALGQLMSNHALREQMSRKAKELTQRFSLDSVLKQWNKLLVEATGHSWPQQ